MALSSDILGYINSAASKLGVSPSYLQKVAVKESAGDPGAYNASGASGLFQFMPKTASEYNLSNPFDAQASSVAAAKLTASNQSFLTGKLGRAPSEGELYLAHNQGATGAYNLISNPNAKATDIVGTNAVIQNGGSLEMTASQFSSKLTGSFSDGEQPLRLNINGTGTAANSGGNDFDILTDRFLGGSGNGEASAGYGGGSQLSASIASYFERTVVIVLGLIFVAVGLSMFGIKNTVVNVIAGSVPKQSS